MKKSFKTFIISQTALLLVVFFQTISSAEVTETLVPQDGKMVVEYMGVRTLEQMKAEEGFQTAFLPRQEEDTSCRMDEPNCSYMKNEANERRTAMGSNYSKPGVREQGSNGPQLAPPAVKFGFAGRSQGNLRPPDTHGAIGKSNFVEVTNSFIDIYRRTGIKTNGTTLASFFGYFQQTIFDPQVIYDPRWNRWIVTAEASPESATVQRFFIAVSRFLNPNKGFTTNGWHIYKVDINIDNDDDFFDYPHIGMDQDSILVTANIFGPVTYREAWLFAISKCQLYNGLGFKVPIFRVNKDIIATVMPPFVLDQNANSYFYGAPQSGTQIRKWRMQNSSHPAQTTVALSTVTVPNYVVPPNADQPGTAFKLDTLDARFINNGTQNGTSSWQVHTIQAFGSFPTPRFYEFNNVTNTVKQSGFFFASGTSDDFMASIATNLTGDTAVVWSSTDTPAGINAQVRISGRQAADPINVIPPGAAAFTSPTFYTGGRWGDYSAVTFEPNPVINKRGWVCAEKINSTNVWGSWINKFQFP